MKILVLGLGNPLVSDDSVGLRVAAALKPLLEKRPGVEVGEDYWGGLRLMERLIDFDGAVVIDALRTGAEPGTIHHLTPAAAPTQRSASAHDVDLPTALLLGRQAGAHLPANENIILIGIEAEDVLNFSETCTPAVEAAIPQAVEAALQTLESLNSGA